MQSAYTVLNATVYVLDEKGLVPGFVALKLHSTTKAEPQQRSLKVLYCLIVLLLFFVCLFVCFLFFF